MDAVVMDHVGPMTNAPAIQESMQPSQPGFSLIALVALAPRLLLGSVNLKELTMLTLLLNAPTKVCVIAPLVNVSALKIMMVLLAKELSAPIAAMMLVFALLKNNLLLKPIEFIPLHGMPRSMLVAFAILVVVDLIAPLSSVPLVLML
jgi:hypothetical protein